MKRLFGEAGRLSVSHWIYVLGVISDPINARSKVVAKLGDTTVGLLCSL